MTRVAIVGAGSLGTIHARAADSLPGVSVAWIADVNPERARAVAQPLGARYTSDPNEAMAAADVDAVIVAVPTLLHRPMTELAAKHGKHVFCEKPIALTLDDANAMVGACREAGVGLMVGHVVRFFPEYARIQQLLHEGVIGQVGVVRARRLNLHPRSMRPWYADVAQSGGMILDLMIHDLDTLRWYFGPVKRVMAHSLSSTPRQLTVDYALAILRFETGVIAHVEGSWAHTSFRTAIEIAGSDGLIRHASDETVALTVEQAEPTANASYVVPSSPLAEGPYRTELRHFLEHLEDQRFLTDGDEATRSLELALAVRTSVETG
ncbi:MAG TPA: Gfo/Idh/MocA family oxidoreductase, partial [Thermomicrobiales bacterium]|nr:Gfo/Idh/MocA family oxidoreductase [Thermomicrobiales bacterium]